MPGRRFWHAAGLAVALCAPAAGQDSAPLVRAADPASPEGIAGEVILYFAGGRTLAEAGGPAFNPFGIDGDRLLFALGAFFVTTEYRGEPVHEGELSIFPQFDTPFRDFTPSVATPGIIPFAFMQKGVCHAGFVAGHPAPDSVYAVDMTDQLCHAGIVEELVYAQYAAANPQQSEPEAEPEAEPAPPQHAFDPAIPSDLDLDVAVWAAYGAASEIANADPDYLFAREGSFAELRAAIAAALEREGLAGIAIEGPVVEPGASFGCAEPATTVLRVGFAAGNGGIVLVAASHRRQSSYVYDPDVSFELDIRPARECRIEGFGRAFTGTLG